MKNIMIAVALTMFASAAIAKDVEGVVKSYEKDTGVLTLEDGTTYTIPKTVTVDATAEMPAAKVKVTVDDADPTKVTGVAVAK